MMITLLSERKVNRTCIENDIQVDDGSMINGRR